MWGYDGLAGSIVIGVGQFREDYGQPYDDPKKGSTFVIPPLWQLALAGGSVVGMFIGGWGAGFVAEKRGRRLCMALSYGKSKPYSFHLT